MDDELDTLLVEVRASTTAFRADIEAMRTSVDTTLVTGFAQAGNVLERGLASAIRRGSLGFDDLRRIALRTLDEIAAQALKIGLDNIFGGGSGGGKDGLGQLVGSLVGAALGLPGRATGGPVSPGTAYMVGERGPEVFVPTSAGRIETGGSSPGRDVRIAINLTAPRGQETPVALRRSTRQLASSVRRALSSQ